MEMQYIRHWFFMITTTRVAVDLEPYRLRSIALQVFSFCLGRIPLLGLPLTLVYSLWSIAPHVFGYYLGRISLQGSPLTRTIQTWVDYAASFWFLSWQNTIAKVTIDPRTHSLGLIAPHVFGFCLGRLPLPRSSSTQDHIDLGRLRHRFLVSVLAEHHCQGHCRLQNVMPQVDCAAGFWFLPWQNTIARVAIYHGNNQPS